MATIVHSDKFNASQDRKASRRKDRKVARYIANIKSIKPIGKAFAEIPKYQFGMKKEFYQTREWRSLRWDVLRCSNMHCKVCGMGAEDGIKLHVDHIKPRSKYPSLELVKENLQVLCEDCNLGKGAK